MPQDPPEDDEDDDAGASAPAREFSRSVTGCHASKKLAHKILQLIVAAAELPGRGIEEMHESFRGDSERVWKVEGFQRPPCRITLRAAGLRPRV